MGDFNEILELKEHSNYPHTSLVTLGMRDFQDVINYGSLQDIKTLGPDFTWCNKREEGLICKKLDRVLLNAAGHQLFCNAYCLMEP